MVLSGLSHYRENAKVPSMNQMDYPDKRTSILLDALRKTIGNQSEYRLFRSGKFDGLFSHRSEASAEAATLALREGYLDSIRRETKGKIVVEWVRLTPKGVEFLYEHDSPHAVLGEMRKCCDRRKQECRPGSTRCWSN